MATETKPRRSKAKATEELARNVFETFRSRDLDAIAATWSEDAVEEIIPVGILRGRDEIRENVRALYAGAPDLEPTLERIIAGDGHAAVQWRGAGTFTGEPFNGIEANGRRVELRVVEMMEFEDGLLARNTVYYDGASFARQIGMMPEQESAAEKAMIAAFNTVTKVRKSIDKRKANA